MDTSVGMAMGTVLSTPETSSLPGAFAHVVRATAWYHGVDYAIVDLSPSVGPFNMMALLTSDALVLPVSASSFSLLQRLQSIAWGADAARRSGSVWRPFKLWPS